ncbi:glycosyltransferase family 2 protein [uncultured Phascolarctobacterium sp.]|uniref:glycosyltransferase family 2 protein n=1 Tax=uncultured Phascolarctobacterium sp. TaxID=512296 RepID=UPI0025D0CA36|nr:glycosyltransferase family A protein [uncultured Phascolarctobacterium sp.]
MKFSFIIGTLNRSNELEYCLESLLAQDYKNFEIIIVDQSGDDKTEDLAKKVASKRIKYNRVSFRGLSKARNYALECATGDYICLTDDDAYYSKNYLSTLKKHFDINPNSIISGYIWDGVNKKDFIDYSKVQEGKRLSTRQIIRWCPSPAISFPKIVYETIGGFDENFGVGAKYGAGEETDFLLRAKIQNYEVFYWSDVKVVHPHENAIIAVDEDAENKKAQNYPFGIGAMYKKQLIAGNIEVLFSLSEQIIKNLVKRLMKRKNADIILSRFIQGYKIYDKDRIENKK